MTTSTPAMKTLTAFSADARGTTAILFALLAVPIFCMALVGMDLSRAEATKSAIISAADSAAKAGAKMLGAPHDQVEDVIRAFLRTNLPPDKKDLAYVLTFAADDTALTIKIDTSVKTSMFAIAGIKKLDIAVESTVQRPALVQIPQPRHRGIDPDIADRPVLNRAPNAREMREAEAEVRAMLEELKRSGGSPDVDRLLRVFGNSR